MNNVNIEAGESLKLIDIILLGVSLAMDATAVSICKGLSMKKLDKKKAITIALYFGTFQAIMPIIGYLLGISFKEVVESIDHWIAFFLLAVIGINMIRESLSKESESLNDLIDFKTMTPLAIATSIDALAIGITFAFLRVNIIGAVTIIGIITIFLSMIGVFIGNEFGNKYGKIAETLGGIVLIGIGLKILLEHLKII